MSNIFNESVEFIEMLRQLNYANENECLDKFKSLAITTSENVPTNANIDTNDTLYENEKILAVILDRIAFYPLSPSDLRVELVRLGLKETLAEGLATVWSDVAKQVVMSRRKIDGEFQGAEFEALCNIKTGEGRINLQLQNADGTKVLIDFTPETLFEFYEQLELVQNNIDKICK